MYRFSVRVTADNGFKSDFLEKKIFSFSKMKEVNDLAAVQNRKRNKKTSEP